MTNELENNQPASETTETTEERPVLPKYEFKNADVVYEPLADAVGASAKQSRKLKILMILLIAAVVLGGLLIYSNHFALFERTMRDIDFDYRNGEAIGESFETDTKHAVTLAQGLSGKDISIQAVMYALDSSKALDSALTIYDYSTKGDSIEVTEQTGASKWLFTDKRTLRQTGGLIEKRSGGKWKEAEDILIPKLDVLFFAAENGRQYTATLHDSYPTTVENTHYNCEIWLIEFRENSQPIYYTLYRYYLDGELVGVRMLNDRSNLMYVYDIRSYSAQ